MAATARTTSASPAAARCLLTLVMFVLGHRGIGLHWARTGGRPKNPVGRITSTTTRAA